MIITLSDNRRTVAPNPAIRTAEATKLFPGIQWTTESMAYIQCPGFALHTRPNGAKDCRLHIDGAPTIFCVHTSCINQRHAANHILRSEIGRAECGGAPSTRPLTYVRTPERTRTAQIAPQVRAKLPALLQEYAWPIEAVRAASPVLIPDKAIEQARLVLALFEPTDVVWIGERFHTSKDSNRCSGHFQQAREWAKRSAVHGYPFTCPSTFKPGSYSRSNESVAERRFLVVESDELGREETAAILRWLREYIGLELVAVLDTAGRGIHGWLRFPSATVLEILKTTLPALGCDPAMFKPSQPVRLAGGTRDGKQQQLLYVEAAR